VTWSNNNNHFTTILPVSLLLKYFRGVKRENGTLWLELQITAGLHRQTEDRGRLFISSIVLAQKNRRPKGAG
jgi:hypothetical protein